MPEAMMPLALAPQRPAGSICVGKESISGKLQGLDRAAASIDGVRSPGRAADQLTPLAPFRSTIAFRRIRESDSTE
jgi:hypothetical protein